jgi:uncharacterized protein (TIGR03437 family)
MPEFVKRTEMNSLNADASRIQACRKERFRAVCRPQPALHFSNCEQYVYYISDTQINVLTPLDGTQGQVSLVATNGTMTSAPFTTTMGTVAPSFLLFGATKYVAATHASGSLLGPTSLSVPGYSFTPAQPGETVVLYGVGFGLPIATLVDGSSSQFGTLPTPPTIQIGGAAAAIQFAGIISPGLYQFNVVVPGSATNGDNAVTASYGGSTTPVGTVIPVQR